MRDVSWWRVVLAFVATMGVLYALTITVSAVGGATIAWIFIYALVSTVVWWGILLYPTRARSASVR